jgi:hypothetical protein
MAGNSQATYNYLPATISEERYRIGLRPIDLSIEDSKSTLYCMLRQPFWQQFWGNVMWIVCARAVPSVPTRAELGYRL